MGKMDAIKVIVIVNVLLFAITYWIPDMEEKMITLFGLFFPENDKFRYWQFVTNMFMHGGFAHILFNMYGLWAFGTPLEFMWGKKKFLFFYFLSGIGASLIYSLVNYLQFNAVYSDFVNLGLSTTEIQSILDTGSYNSALTGISEEKLSNFYALFHTPAVGASGAIYGILVAFAFSFPNSKMALIFLPFPIAAKYFIPLLIALDLFSGVTGYSIFGGGIAHFAHVGGALIGFLLMWIWRKKTKNDDPVIYQ